MSGCTAGMAILSMMLGLDEEVRTSSSALSKGRGGRQRGSVVLNLWVLGLERWGFWHRE